MSRPLDPAGGATAHRFGGLALPDGIDARLRALDLAPEIAVLAWEIARLADDLDAAGRRALLHLALATQVQLRQGSTRLPLGEHGSGSPALDGVLDRLGASAAEKGAVRTLAQAIARGEGPRGVIGRPGEHRPLLVEDSPSGLQLVPQAVWAREQRLADALGARCRAADDLPGGLDAAVEAASVGAGATLSDEQSAAVRRCLSGRLTVISGGPGTGKTSIVVAILRALVRIGVPPAAIALAAPTGKAANRLDEAIRRGLAAIASATAPDRALAEGLPSPRTLHRLLGYSPSQDRFRRDAASPLGEDVVIVDEASMIDLHLMDCLVQAVRGPARLVLLGDAEQLPSVEAGAVLRDLVAPEPLAATDPRGRASVRLTRSYRMDPADPDGRHVLAVARALNAGHPEALFEGADAIRSRDRVEALEDRGVELLDRAGTEAAALLDPFLDRWWRRCYLGADSDGAAFDRGASLVARRDSGGALRLAADGDERAGRLLARLDRFRLLCLTRGGDRSPFGAGVESLNAALHRRRLDADGASARAAPAFLPGEPVILQSNDYQRNLWNGDQGVVLRVGGAGRTRAMVAFPRPAGIELFPLDALRGDLALGYAMSVHKAQGSEFDQVGLILPSGPAALDLPLLSRELLYTAVSRARRSVVVVGRREVLLVGAARRIERSSGLGEKLARAT